LRQICGRKIERLRKMRERSGRKIERLKENATDNSKKNLGMEGK
jgi:hypothetical protein